MQVITRLIATVTIALLAGCPPALKLRPRLILHEENVGNEFWLGAPYVLAVKIVNAELRGSPEPIFQGGPRVLQLVKFAADVENVIKGDLPDRTITFFFFAKVDQNPNYYLHPGRRYIVSLRREAGVLRSFADASQLQIEVFSGSHSQKDLPLELGPEATIAYILLTAGVDCDLFTFINRLEWPSNNYGDPGYVNQRLKELQLSSNRDVRDSACLAAAAWFGHLPQCLEQCLHSAEADIRRRAEELLKTDDPNLPGLLRNPSSLFAKARTDYISEMFEIYTEDIRPEVRQAACAAWRSFDPPQAAGHCR